MEDLQKETLLRLRKCVDQSHSVDAFREWFVPVSWDIEQIGESDVIGLVHRLDGILAEASSAGWKDEDILDQMSNILREYTKSYDEVCEGRPPAQIAQSHASYAINHA